MLDPAAITAYWQHNALDNIMPDRNGVEFPEGVVLFQVMRDQLRRENFSGYGNVLEFGCGRGRLAPFFHPEFYLGVDICADAIEIAKRNNPLHRFQLIEPFAMLPPADAVFAYAVLHHIPDENLAKVAAQLQPFEKIVIAEIMEPRRRQKNMPPCLNRDFAEYLKLFPHRTHTKLDVPNQSYRNTSTTILTLCND